MKEYGAMRATEFTRKQIGAIYRAAKNGDLRVEKWAMAHLYNLADYYNYDYNRNVTDKEPFILKIIELVFEHNYEEAQIRLDRLSNETFESYGYKRQASLDRTEIVK